MNTKTIAIELSALSSEQRATMLAAGREAQRAARALKKAGLNIVGEVLRDQGEFIELEHYPKDDVFDNESFSQYYYHAHRDAVDEHGHFHLFLRAGGMPECSTPIDYPQATEAWPTGGDAICHLIAIAMDSWGEPIGLFCTNRWVTAEAWYSAEQTIAMLDRFVVDHAAPNWAVNRWLSAMVRLYRPYLEALIRQRDEAITELQRRFPDRDVFEDRGLDITGYLPISVVSLVGQLEMLEISDKPTLDVALGRSDAVVTSEGRRRSEGRTRFHESDVLND